MGEPQLLPCPFCGNSDAFVERLDNSSSMVICQGMVDENSACMARGPVGIQDDDGEEQPGYAAAVREWNARAQAQEASVAVPTKEVRKVVTGAMVSMVAGVTGLVPPSSPGAIPDFVQAPIDRAVTQITELLSAAPPAAQGLSGLIVALATPDSDAWLKLAKAAAKYGVRYSTNDNMVEFLRALAGQAE